MRRAARVPGVSMSCRVRATYDRMNLWGDDWLGPALRPRSTGPGSGPSDRAEKANGFNAGPSGPSGPGTSVGHGQKNPGGTNPRLVMEAAPGTNGGGLSSRTDDDSCLDHLDHLDQASNGAAFSGPSDISEAGPPGPSPVPWPDLDALRQAYGGAQGGGAKRAMVATWAAAAG